MSFPRNWIAAASIVGLLPLALHADTLYLRNGQRVEGDLVAVRNGVVEFQERRGFGGARLLRLNRSDIDRIDFDSPGGGSDFGGGSGGSSGGFGGNNGGGFGGGNGRPNGMRERQVNVSATTAWNDTGIELRPGQTIYVQATGEVRWGRNRRDGPEGENNSPFNQARPLPNRPAGALIGSVGQGDDIFFIGAETGAIRVRGGGRLVLGVNDEFLQDNSGSFRVTVYY